MVFYLVIEIKQTRMGQETFRSEFACVAVVFSRIALCLKITTVPESLVRRAMFHHIFRKLLNLCFRT